MFELTGFQRDILYCVAGAEPPSGPNVMAALEDYHIAEVKHSRYYVNLNELIDEGYLTKGSVDERTNSYQITADGRQLLAERQEWEERKLSDTTL
jgi:DNA-binding PadR family transcriptional regulator